MKFCCECGGRVEVRPGGQGVGQRFVCAACGRSYFASPRLAAACLVEANGQILLCRRNATPGYGLWGLPGGFLDAGEGAARGAQREILEEAGVEVEILRPYALLHIPAENVMQIVYLARLLGDTLVPGPESLEVRFFSEEELPWEALAMSSTREVLRRYYQEMATGDLGFLYVEIVPFPW